MAEDGIEERSDGEIWDRTPTAWRTPGRVQYWDFPGPSNIGDEFVPGRPDKLTFGFCSLTDLLFTPKQEFCSPCPSLLPLRCGRGEDDLFARFPPSRCDP